MPKRRQTSQGGKKKTKSMKVTSLRPYKQPIPWMYTTMPDQMFIKLKYATSYRITAAQFHKVFSGNGLYDPDVSGVGHQPLGFDQWMTLYNRYRVYASRIVVNVVNLQPTDINPNNLVTDS